MFKDNWDANSDTLTSAIAKIAVTDVSTAIQMWTYLLTKHSRKIKSDSKITGGILDDLPSETYEEIANNHFLIEKLFKQACEPWESVSLITHFLGVSEFSIASKLLDLVFNNKTVSEYNYTDYKSSNLSTCLYMILNRLYNFNDNDIEFLSEWIERISDNTEKMKLKVMLISKEASEPISYSSSSNSRRKNEYLLDEASLEDLDMASSRREDFEIKKLIEKVCDYSIGSVDFSRLDVRWMINIFREEQSFTEDYFNIIGAYFWFNGLSWETKSILQDIYKNQIAISTIAKNSYRGESEATITQRLNLVISEIRNSPYIWNFSFVTKGCENIISLCNAYEAYITHAKETRYIELAKYADISIDTLDANTRIKNILVRHNFQDLGQLIDILDLGTHLDGLGDKSLKLLKDKIECLGIKLLSVNDDINFLFRLLGINCDAYTLSNTTEIYKKLNLSFDTFDWHFSRLDLMNFIKRQHEIAMNLSEKFSEINQGIMNNMEKLRKDDENIYIPGRYFFREINRGNIRFH